MTKISIFKASTAPLALGLALAASPALAQDEATDAGADTSTTSSAIIVTGSRIARPNVESASPVTSVDAEQIQLTGDGLSGIAAERTSAADPR
jgi:outer membrane cobalamin receptor